MLMKKLKLGDTIGIISPSAPVTEDLKEQLEKGINVFESFGFNLKIGKNVYSNTLGYSASPEEKASDINKMFLNKEIAAVFCSQGGNNSNSCLPYIDFEVIKNNPKIFYGISDCTILLNAIYAKTGIVTIHQSDVIWGFGREKCKFQENDFIERLIDGKIGEVNKNSQWKCIREGIVEGIIVGGNLSCITKLINTEYMCDLTDKILFIEDYDGESTFEIIDSYINYLKYHKVFDKIKGLWLGYYRSDTDKLKFEDVVINNIKEYNFPVLKCNDFGHNCENIVIPIGSKIKMDATNCKVEILDEFLV